MRVVPSHDVARVRDHHEQRTGQLSDHKTADEQGRPVTERLRDGVPVLFSSHQLDLVDRLCDSLVVLSGGVVQAYGTAAELRSRGPRRYRIRTGADAGWLREEPQVEVLDVDGPTALVQFPGDIPDGLLARAVDHHLTEFSPIVPTLADIYREVTR